MTRPLALLTALCVPVLASACPWTGPLQVSTTIRTVTVNGLTHDVKGPHDRVAFGDLLASCGADAALAEYQKWRNARLATNVTGVGGVVVDDRAFIGTVAAALLAGSHRRDFERALRATVIPEPTPVVDGPLAIAVSGG